MLGSKNEITYRAKKRPQRFVASLKNPQRVIPVMGLIKIASTRCGYL